MANYIEKTDIRATNFVPLTSRYSGSAVIYYTERKKIAFLTYKKTPYKITDGDRFMVITKGVEYRPDLVSYDMYGTTNFWWRIMEANGMKDILEFSVGTNIRIPNNVMF